MPVLLQIASRLVSLVLLAGIATSAFAEPGIPPAISHWAFRAVQPVPSPAVHKSESAPTAIDRFIVSKLEADTRRLAPPADKRTLIRRATYDLTGLPPTPEEVDAFLADNSPGAFAKVVERLLASPHYGEH